MTTVPFSCVAEQLVPQALGEVLLLAVAARCPCSVLQPEEACFQGLILLPVCMHKHTRTHVHEGTQPHVTITVAVPSSVSADPVIWAALLTGQLSPIFFSKPALAGVMGQAWPVA